LLDSYQIERWPVGRVLLRYTDRVFSLFRGVMAGSRVAAWFRKTVVSRIVPRIFRSQWLKGLAFNFASELGIHYRRSPAVGEGAPRLRRGPRAGDRLPDAPFEHNGRPTHLQRQVAGARFSLLLCGAVEGWDRPAADALAAQFPDLLKILYVTQGSAPDALVDRQGQALQRLGLRTSTEAGQYLIRPDGYIAARCAGRDLGFMNGYLARWIR
jgi:hypothetical protein